MPAEHSRNDVSLMNAIIKLLEIAIEEAKKKGPSIPSGPAP